MLSLHRPLLPCGGDTAGLVAAAVAHAPPHPSTGARSERPICVVTAAAFSCTALLAGALRARLQGRRRLGRGPRFARAEAILAAAGTADAPAAAAASMQADAPAAAMASFQENRVVRRVADVIIVVTKVIRDMDDERMPDIGDPVRFTSGAVAYIIAISDLCFAAALKDPADTVEMGESYEIASKAARPMIRVPQKGGMLIDAYGAPLVGAESEVGRTHGDDGDERTAWFNEMVELVRRQRIDTPLHAGVMALDAFVPIGRGQSMLLRLPTGLTQEDLRQFMAHVVDAQSGSQVHSFVPVTSKADGRLMQDLVKDAGSAERLTVVAGESEGKRPGEAVLAMNAACALAEAHRDKGGDALLLLDIEPLYRVWAELADVVDKEGLEQIVSENQASPSTDEIGVRLWKYVAKKNAATARKRTFLGCFLQRACRMAKDRGNGSLTLLAFARIKDSALLSRLDLEAKLKNLQQMKLDESTREKAVEKIQAQITAIPEDGGGAGVPDSFVEEAKAVTDGHVVFSNATKDPEGRMRWSVDLQESVARGITADSVQNRPLHLLRSLNLKMYMIHREEGDRSINCAEVNSTKQLDYSPIVAMLQQPVGDVLSVEEEATLLTVALADAEIALAATPLIEDALKLLARAKVSFEEEAAERLVKSTRQWAEAQWRRTPGCTSMADLNSEDLQKFAESLELRPLEKKRVLSVGADPSQGAEQPVEVPSVADDLNARYAELRASVRAIADSRPGVVASVAEPGLGDTSLTERLAFLRAQVIEATCERAAA
mmetsp:Transcript_106032/g.236686  ORF Transcript_106032/g.236686 Transcript_106032/m.236686 type:complete len:776 (-) Transcript_106032:73-2400(-)